MALALLPAVFVVLAAIWPVAMLCQGRPFLYGCERMRAPGEAFRLWKIRTMRVEAGAAPAVLGGDRAALVTPLGRWLRRTRLDEVPQIFNVLAGDMRFIGPRPPLRRYVEAYPALYARVLRRRPGITGLATVMLHRREERLLSACRNAEETDRVYRRDCIPIKARLDLLYASRRSWRLDALILWRTGARLFVRKPRAIAAPRAPRAARDDADGLRGAA